MKLIRKLDTLKKTFSFIFFVCLTGCGTLITIPIDQTLINPEEATVIIYHEQGFSDEFKIFLDKTQLIGVVTAEKPLKVSLRPGEHELHADVTMAIDRIHKQIYEAGKIYYMSLWLDIGAWVSSIRITPVTPVSSYEVTI